MITKFSIFKESSATVNMIADELKYLLEEHFGLHPNFIKTEKLPTELIIEFKNNITSKEPWFFKILQICKMYSYRVNIVKNRLELIKIKRYDL